MAGFRPNEMAFPVECVLESWNHVGWERSLISSSPAANLTLLSPLNHVPKRHTYTSSKYLRGWWHSHFPGQAVPLPPSWQGDIMILLTLLLLTS